MKKWLLVLIGLIVVAFGISTGISLWQDFHLPAEEAVRLALEKTLSADEYQYTSTSVRVLDGKEETLSVLNGRKKQGNTYLGGQMPIVNSKIEVYQIADTFYRQDVVNGQWLIVNGYDEEATEVLLQEIDPLSNFYLQGEYSAECLGKEKADGVRCKKYQVYTSKEGSYLSSLWSEYYYTLWIDRKGTIQQIEMIATDDENKPELLKMTVQFDWYSPVEDILPPV